MRTKNLVLIVAVGLAFGALILGSATSSGQFTEKRPVVAWEYQTYFGSDRQSHDEELNKLGQEGWELVAVTSDPRHLIRYVLKRPKSD